MSDLQIILSEAGAALALLITAVTFLAKFIKSAKAKKAAEELIKIGSAVLPYIKKAESFVNFSGAEKKEYALTKANQFAVENGITFDVKQVSEKIEELVSLTKSVNMREKDRLCSASSCTAAEYAECMSR